MRLQEIIQIRFQGAFRCPSEASRSISVQLRLHAIPLPLGKHNDLPAKESCEFKNGIRIFCASDTIPVACSPCSNDDETVNIVLLSASEVYLTLDGQSNVQLRQGDRVQVKQSPNRVLLVRNPQIDYFGILRAKLRWGAR